MSWGFNIYNTSGQAIPDAKEFVRVLDHRTFRYSQNASYPLSRQDSIRVLPVVLGLRGAPGTRHAGLPYAGTMTTGITITVSEGFWTYEAVPWGTTPGAAHGYSEPNVEVVVLGYV